MVRKFCLVAIALVGIATWGGCRTPYGGRRALNGSSCGSGSCGASQPTYVPASGGGYVPSAPAPVQGGGGSGMRGSGTR